MTGIFFDLTEYYDQNMFYNEFSGYGIYDTELYTSGDPTM